MSRQTQRWLARFVLFAATVLFAMGSFGIVNGSTTWGFIPPLPCWFLLLAATLWMLHLRQRRSPRVAYPRCAQCGYDLTGNVSGRCPECGEPIPRDASANDTHEEEA